MFDAQIHALAQRAENVRSAWRARTAPALAALNQKSMMARALARKALAGPTRAVRQVSSEAHAFARTGRMLALRTVAGPVKAAKAGGRLVGRVSAAFHSEQLRERLLATGVFAALALFAAASLDYLVSGGADWNNSAEAAPLVRAEYVQLGALPEVAYAPPAPREALDAAFAETVVTPVAYVKPAGELLGGPLPGNVDPSLDAIRYVIHGAPLQLPTIGVGEGADLAPDMPTF